MEMELGNMMFGNSRGEYELDRDLYQDIVWQGLKELGCSSYGFVEDERLKQFENYRGGITTDMFETYPYWWGDEDNEEETSKANFIFKPTEYEIQWYKYALRDSYANQDLAPHEVENIFEKCYEYLQKLVDGFKYVPDQKD